MGRLGLSLAFFLAVLGTAGGFWPFLKSPRLGRQAGRREYEHPCFFPGGALLGGIYRLASPSLGERSWVGPDMPALPEYP